LKFGCQLEKINYLHSWLHEADQQLLKPYLGSRSLPRNRINWWDWTASMHLFCHRQNDVSNMFLTKLFLCWLWGKKGYVQGRSLLLSLGLASNWNL